MEELITEAANKGSVSSGGPSRCGTPEGFFKFYMEICRKIYRDNVRIMGKIVMEAKRKVISQNSTNDQLYGPAVVWTLFGDPALRIRHRISSAVEELRTGLGVRASAFIASTSATPASASPRSPSRSLAAPSVASG
jgi:hypothetical protein